jgi:signal transduction histidine kinase
MSSDKKYVQSHSKAAASEPPAPTQRDIGPLFLANFVHQVVNPMNGVIGTLDNITDGTYTGAVVGQKVNACRAQLEQCVTLIRNLAYLSNYFFEVSGDQALRPPREGGQCVVPQVIIEALQFYQVSAGKRRMGIELVDARTQYKVNARPELLKQVFLNLFDNWLKYGLSDQIIKIETRVNNKNELIIETTGRSIGFSDPEIIFKLGERSKEAQEKVAQGSGIGLYICRQIVEKTLGGRISAQHNRTTGVSTFHIVIPSSRWSL